MAKINFFTDGIRFQLTQKRKIKKWLEIVANDYNKRIASINYIFTSDLLLSKLNKEYLSHNTLTDIITFNQSTTAYNLEADIFISIDRITENSLKFKTTFEDELHRVIVHGLLHLVGLNDKTVNEKTLMRNSENHYLALLAQIKQ